MAQVPFPFLFALCSRSFLLSLSSSLDPLSPVLVVQILVSKGTSPGQ